MANGRAIILAVACAAALAGCGAGIAPAGGPLSPPPASSRSPAPSPSPALVKKLGASAAASAVASAARTATVSLEPSDQVPFTGDTVTVTAQASTSINPLRWLRLASLTVAFGDGVSVSATQSCTGAHQAPAASGLPVRHVYRRAGQFTAQVTSARVCAWAGPVSTSAASATIPVLPAAPPASASWPVCTGAGAVVAARVIGAGLGHVGVLFTVHNTSASGCRLSGYAELRLLGRGGPLPTTVQQAVSGTYLFPPVAPHLVAVAPGGYAAFELEYVDNPFGAGASEPYATACPAATQADVTLPGTSASSAVPAAMAPCNGQVWISPVIPGRRWINFP
jgi:Protein of unknown function (DUF4232)